MGFVKCVITFAVVLFLVTGKSKALNMQRKKLRDGVKYYDPSIYRLPGEWMLIKCNIFDWAPTTLSFKPNGTTNISDLPVDNEKIKLASKNVFNITRLVYEDSGEYICFIITWNASGMVEGEVTRHQLTVLKEGKAYTKARIQKKPNEAYYDIGSNVNLTCEAEKNTNLYKIIWYKHDSQGYSIKLKSALNGPGMLTLTLNSLSAHDSRSYKCEVFRPQVNYYNSRFVNISVKVKPEIQLAATYLFTEKGMIINCSLKNADEVNPPEVKYTWFLCGSASCDEESAKLKIESYSLRLNSQARAIMMYRCIAQNAAGSDSKIIKVLKIMTGKSKALNKRKRLRDGVKYYDPSIYRLPGEWMLINCDVHPFLRATLSFMSGNLTYLRHASLTDLHVDNKKIKLASKNVFNITRLAYDDSGQYICSIIVLNASDFVEGEVTRHYLIVLKEGEAHMKAKIQKKPNETYYDVGSYVNLTCEADKNTNLYKIIWYKLDSQGNPIKLKSALNGSAHGILTLTLNSLSAQDSGRYKCEVFRPQVNYYNSEFVNINVKVKPELAKLEKTYIFKKGKMINCTLKNAKEVIPPQVTYTWFSCDNASCDVESVKREKYSLPLNSQARTDMFYKCIAKNAAGSDSWIIDVYNPEVDPTPGQKRTLIFVAAGSGFMCLITLIASSLVLYKRKKLYGGFYLFSFPPLPDYIENLDSNKDIQEQVHILPFIPAWEFPRERITFVNELGSGQFGVVWLAEAVGISAFHPREMLKEREGGGRFSFFWRKPKKPRLLHSRQVTNVAVKSIKENADRKCLVDLQSELKILIHVGENENIVNILGACTKGKSSNLWIIMEYCPNGNLREFLQSSRNIYDVDEEALIPDPGQAIGPKTLMYFAWQITKGMTFLISRKVIHRDLAVRNILLGEAYVAKIGDFGLARDVYKYQKYSKKSSGFVPIRWMAIESIGDLIFTEKSDVWSFGVLLWELFTLGETPYPGMPAMELYESLVNGKRMEPPINCPHEIADVMSKCWKEDPDNRPNFHRLKEMLYEILCWETMSQTFAENEQTSNTSTPQLI